MATIISEKSEDEWENFANTFVRPSLKRIENKESPIDTEYITDDVWNNSLKGTFSESFRSTTPTLIPKGETQLVSTPRTYTSDDEKEEMENAPTLEIPGIEILTGIQADILVDAVLYNWVQLSDKLKTEVNIAISTHIYGLIKNKIPEQNYINNLINIIRENIKKMDAEIKDKEIEHYKKKLSENAGDSTNEAILNAIEKYENGIMSMGQGKKEYRLRF